MMYCGMYPGCRLNGAIALPAGYQIRNKKVVATFNAMVEPNERLGILGCIAYRVSDSSRTAAYQTGPFTPLSHRMW